MVSLKTLHPQVCWERSVETLTARKDDIAGLAVASDERIEAYILYIEGWTRVVSFRSFVDDGGARLKQLLSRLRAQGMTDLPVLEGPPGGDLDRSILETLGFRPAGGHLTLRREGALRLTSINPRYSLALQ